MKLVVKQRLMGILPAHAVCPDAMRPEMRLSMNMGTRDRRDRFRLRRITAWLISEVDSTMRRGRLYLLLSRLATVIEGETNQQRG